MLTAHAQRLSSARAAQMVEIRGLLGDMRCAASAAGFQLAGQLVCGDLNIPAGTTEQWAASKLLGWPPPRDLCDTDSTPSFPLAVWKGGRYVRRIPGTRLDYIMDCSAQTSIAGGRIHPVNGEYADKEVCASPLMLSSAHVEPGCAEVTAAEQARCDTGGLVSDHAPVLAVVTCQLSARR